MNQLSCRDFFLSLLLILSLTPLVAAEEGPGLPNVEQVKGELISGPWGWGGGRTAVVAYHQGYIINQYELPGSGPGADGKARFYDASDLQNLKTKYFDTGWNNIVGAHGYWFENAVIRGIKDWTFEGSNIKRVHDEALTGGKIYNNWTAKMQDRFSNPKRGLLFQPYHVSMFWSYGNTDHKAGIFKRNELLAEWDPVKETGVIGHPYIIGNYVYYLSDQSSTGIAVYDFAEAQRTPGTKPKLVGLFKQPLSADDPEKSVGGYWPEIWSGHGKVKAVFPDGDGIEIVDITDPSEMTLDLAHDTRVDRDWRKNTTPAYVQFQDDYAFTSAFKVNMMTLEVETIIDPLAHDIKVGQFSLPVGNLLLTGGSYSTVLGQKDQLKGRKARGMGIWAHQSEPDLKAPVVGFHVPRRSARNYYKDLPISVLIHETLRAQTIVNGETFMVRPVNADQTVGDAVAGRLVYSFNDVLTFTPDDGLLENTTYEVYIPAGGIQDAMANGITEFKYRFSTGATLIDYPNSVTPAPGIPVGDKIINLDLQLKLSRKGKLKAIKFELPTEQRVRGKTKKVKVILMLNGRRILKLKTRRKRNIKLKVGRNKKMKRLLGVGINQFDLSVFKRKNLIAQGQIDFRP